MERYTQKQLRSLVENGVAIDISYYDNDGRNAIEQKETSYTQIGYASGVYGCNGIFKDAKQDNYTLSQVEHKLYIYLKWRERK